MPGTTNEWMKFFSVAGIPSKYAAKYAAIFQDHRIQKDMLKDLNKEILSDMGIKTMGDVIAIMRHAKEVDEEETRAKVLGWEDRASPVASKGKIVRSISRKEPDKMTNQSGISTSLAKRLGGTSASQGTVKRTVVQRSEDLPIKKRISAPRTVSHEKVVRFSTGSSGSSSSVFDRLGATSNTALKPSSVSTVTSGSILRRNGGEIALTAASVSSFQQAMKATATVKPLKASSTSSLSARFSASSSSPYSIKDRLGGVAAAQQQVKQKASIQAPSSPLMNLITRNVQSQSKVVPLKKSIFDRLGS